MMESIAVSNESIACDEKRLIAKAAKLPYYPVAFQRGQGALLYDYDGKEYIDFLSSASSAGIGHGNREIANAVKEQMEKLAQYTAVYFYSHESVKLAEKLISLSPISGSQKVMFSCTGSAAVDGAIKVARAYTGRSKIISFYEAYHGSTYGALSISAISTNMRRKIGPLLPEIYHFNYPDCFRCKYGQCETACQLECFQEIETAFKRHLPAEEVAALFIEPIAGDAGIIVPPARYVAALYDLCKRNGILLVFDEIQTGLGRTGKWFGMEHFAVKPDLFILGKAVGGGLPLGVLVGNAAILDSINAPGHIFTLGGNSTVCAASLKMLEIMEKERLVERAAELGEYLKARLTALQAKYEIIGDVRGLGLSIAVDLVTDRKTRRKNYEAAAKICYRCIEQGLVLIFFGESCLRVQPPLVITKEQIDQAVSIIDAAMYEYLHGEIGDDALQVVQGW